MVVNTVYGQVEGEAYTYGWRFLGIPYAKPPVGELRFLPPVEPEKWDGVRECTHFGNVAPQLRIKELKILEPTDVIDEDCLYLNVFTPGFDDEKRPVMVFFHGGAFQKGSGNLNFSPDEYVKQGIVVVNMNFRLGALGFLDFSEYLGSAYNESGNTGLLDMICSLKWVKKNIENFGGDPDNVTIMGQSAGAKSVSALLIMEKAKGLFDKAVVCSGGVQSIRDRETAYKTTRSFMKDAGLTKENAEKILTMPWQDIVEAQKNIFAGLNLHTIGPVFDGVNFAEDNALDIIRHKKTENIPLIVGTNRDEMKLYYNKYKFYELDEVMAVRLFGTNADIVLREYHKIPKDEHFEKAYVGFLTEYIYRNGAMGLCEAYTAAGNKELYLFRNDFDKQPDLAGHTMETQFVMKAPNPEAEKSKEYYELADGVFGSMISFMRYGKPETAKLPEWPPYYQKKEMMVWDLVSHVDVSEKSRVAEDFPEQVYKL